MCILLDYLSFSSSLYSRRIYSGHIRALLETGCLPNIVSGTSAGSVIGAILCTRTDEELVDDLRPEIIHKHMTCFARPWLERIKSVWKTGNMFDQEDWNQLIKWFTNGDMTFEEAYQKTGRVFCITLSSTSKKAPPVLLNHLSAPNVVIASAVIASAAVPGFIPPVRLRYKDSKGNVRYYGKGGESYYDGSIRSDVRPQRFQLGDVVKFDSHSFFVLSFQLVILDPHFRFGRNAKRTVLHRVPV